MVGAKILRLLAALAFLLASEAVIPIATAQPAPPAAPALGPALVSDLVAAYRALASLSVLDAFGHVSVRDPRNPQHYLIVRSLAPESVSAGDILVLDLDSKPVDPQDASKLLYRERFIHGEIYKDRPDVNAIVHSHSPTVVPFTVTGLPLRPILHNAGFLGLGTPLFEIRKFAGAATNLEIETPALGQALARTLGPSAGIVLMRGHGDTVVASNLQNAVFRAYYAEVNARQLEQAMALGRPITYLTKEEAKTSDESMMRASSRPWALWKEKVLQAK